MEFDFSWLLWGLPVAFVLGWIASRLDLRQLRIENRQAPKAYFRGLNYLLNEQQDQAIDAFIDAVRNDPDTSELHFALGNLFRRRGEYDRAVRVHEHLLSRGDLNRQDRTRAQHALALDFLKAGLLDRAEDALRKLEGTEYEPQALVALLSIYERTRDWQHAVAVARRLEARGEAGYGTRLSHYLCEQAAQASGLPAQRLLEQALQATPDAPRPAIELAAARLRGGDAAGALDSLGALAAQAPAALPLFSAMLADAALASGRTDAGAQVLRRALSERASLDVLDALARLEPNADSARALYLGYLQNEPSLLAAGRWLGTADGLEQQAIPLLRRAVDHASKPLARYRCAACGFETNRHFWQCPGCQTWDSYPPRRVEEL